LPVSDHPFVRDQDYTKSFHAIFIKPRSIMKISIHLANIVEQLIIQIKSKQNNNRADKNT